METIENYGASSSEVVEKASIPRYKSSFEQRKLRFFRNLNSRLALRLYLLYIRAVISHDTKLMKNGALEKTNRLDSHEKIAYF
jgi:hypothetical protein